MGCEVGGRRERERDRERDQQSRVSKTGLTWAWLDDKLTRYCVNGARIWPLSGLELWMRKRAELDQARSWVSLVGSTERSASTGTMMRERKKDKKEKSECHSPIAACVRVCESFLREAAEVRSVGVDSDDHWGGPSRESAGEDEPEVGGMG